MKKRLFGRDAAGRAVEEVILESADAAVSILSLGCIVRDWRIDAARGQPADGARLPAASRTTSTTPARTARSSGGWRTAPRDRASTLDGKTWELTPNEGAHHLHGGPGGLGSRIWEMEGDSAVGHGAARLRERRRRGGLSRGWSTSP